SASSTLGKGIQVFESALSSGPGWGPGTFGSSQVGGAAVTASVGRAASLGALSVPQGWTSAAPAFSQAATALPGGSGPSATAPVVPTGSAAPFGAPPAQTGGRGGTSSPLAARYFVRPAVVQRPVYGG
ncbi:MAG TPA: PE/PPE C-terminal domain-containing protein, partial [Pseudonocardiaceae bacterium]|nr:PE/PPE C-terminal domain-containing protein [Pseudonocardiaceae bacterium]